MSEFLKAWDRAIVAAHDYGKEACVVRNGGLHIWRWPLAHGITGTVVARTMHPSFMQPKQPKYDPRRDA